MRYFLALLPILVVLALMIRLRWGAHRAGPIGWLVGLAAAAAGFGLTPEVFWVSQGKGLLLSGFVLAVMWPALFLYHWVDQNGGISAAARALAQAIPNRGMCLLLLAWALSGLLEGLAGFGIPVAVVAPMLAALGVSPLRAVAAVAIGHSWAVTFGDLGVIFQTLVAVVGLPGPSLIPWAAFLLGASCLFCGLAAAAVLGELKQWPKVTALALIMAGTQFALAAIGLVALAAFGAGLAGLVAYAVFARLGAKTRVGSGVLPPADRRSAILAAVTYGSLSLLMACLSLLTPVRESLQTLVWKAHFPAVTTLSGFQTPAGSGQVIRPLVHPGAGILLVAGLGIVALLWRGHGLGAARRAASATGRSAGLASLGILSMVGLSTLLDHSGMSYLLAQGLSRLLGPAYPILSPCVGMLGAFATGSNNNSNVLFGMLQKNVAEFQHLNPELLVAAQTAGGSLGSMLAPAKIVVGCSTVGQVGQEGQVLRTTVPFGLGIGLVVGLLTWILSRL